MKDKPLFTISVAARLLKTHPRTLMAYERETLNQPFRTKTQRRLYSKQDLEDIQFLQFLTQKKGVNLAGIRWILEAIKKAKEHNLDLVKNLFPDFQLKRLI